MRPATILKEVQVNLTIDDLAKAFCDLSDDGQARFFVAVAKEMKGWDCPQAMQFQIGFIGGHLVTCECSTEDAREWVTLLAEAIKIKSDALDQPNS